jgi:hypothetical protein
MEVPAHAGGRYPLRLTIALAPKPKETPRDQTLAPARLGKVWCAHATNYILNAQRKSRLSSG